MDLLEYKNQIWSDVQILLHPVSPKIKYFTWLNNVVIICQTNLNEFSPLIIVSLYFVTRIFFIILCLLIVNIIIYF